MFYGAAAFNQDLCGWTTTTNGNFDFNTAQCINDVFCGENGSNSCGTD